MSFIILHKIHILFRLDVKTIHGASQGRVSTYSCLDPGNMLTVPGYVCTHIGALFVLRVVVIIAYVYQFLVVP